MSGPSGQDTRQQDPHTNPSHRPSRPRRAALSVTLRHAPHRTSCTSTSAAPHKATSRTSATRKTSDAARSSFSLPCHRYAPLRTRRLGDSAHSTASGFPVSRTPPLAFFPALARLKRAQQPQLKCLSAEVLLKCFLSASHPFAPHAQHSSSPAA